MTINTLCMDFFFFYCAILSSLFCCVQLPEESRTTAKKNYQQNLKISFFFLSFIVYVSYKNIKYLQRFIRSPNRDYDMVFQVMGTTRKLPLQNKTNFIAEIGSHKSITRNLWTDSMYVLHWVKKKKNISL